MNRLKSIGSTLSKAEPVLFLTISLLTVLPIFIYDYFTLDGAAHLYNALSIDRIWAGDEFLEKFVQLNPSVVPNWTGHLILILLSHFLDPLLAEHIMMAGICLALAFSFRSCIKAVDGHMALSYFVFPFCYSFTFLMGFYNFSIGLVFFLSTLAFYIKNKDKMNGRRLFGLFLLFILTYFSHVFVFVLLIGFVMGDSLLRFSAMRDRVEGKRFLWIALAGILPLAMSLNYIYAQPSPVYAKLELSELIHQLLHIKSLTVFNDSREFKYVLFLLIPIGSLLIAALWRSRTSRQHGVHDDSWMGKKVLIYALLILSAFFLFPDSNTQAGYITVRLQLIFYLLFILWLSISVRVIQKLAWYSLPLVFFAHFALIGYYNKVFTDKSLLKKEMALMAKDHISAHSIVTGTGTGSDWFTGNLFHYLGVYEEGVLVLNNYELGTGYFPLVATEDMKQVKSDLRMPRLRAEHGQEIELYVILGQEEDQSGIGFEMEELYNSENYRLFKWKSE